MGWDDIELKLKEKFANNYVSCNEQTEIDALRALIKGEFPNLGDDEIEAGLNKCRDEVEDPKPIKDFLKCLIGTLDF
jgi:hypothetical protein